MRNGLGRARELGRHARHAVIEAAADGDQEVAVIGAVVGIGRTVHAEHVQRQRIGCVVGAQAHQRHRRGNAESAGERAQFAGRVGMDHATADIEQRALR
jgi:hypothetical protein